MKKQEEKIEIEKRESTDDPAVEVSEEELEKEEVEEDAEEGGDVDMDDEGKDAQ